MSAAIVEPPTATPAATPPPETKALPPGKAPSVIEAAQKAPTPPVTPKEDALHLFGRTPRAKPVEKKEDKAKTDADAKAEADKAAKDSADAEAKAKAEQEARDKAAEEKPVKAKPRKEPAAVTEERIAEIAARTTAHMQKPAAVAEAKPVELPASLKAELPRLQKLEELFPDKYPKGTAQRQVDFELKAIEYERDWRKKNGNAKFDPESDEHDAFYREQPEIEERDLEAAKEAVLEDRAEKRALEKISPKLQAIEREQLRVKAEPEAVRAQSTVTDAMFRAMNPAAKEVTNAEINAWASTHPFEAAIIGKEEAAAQAVAKALSLVWDGAEIFDESSEAHRKARDAGAAFESQLAGVDPAETADAQGRTWLPYAAFNALPGPQQAKHYTTDKNHLIRFVANESAAKAKQLVESLTKQGEEWAKKLGYTKLGASETPLTAPKPEEVHQQETPTPAARALPSPSLGSGTPLSPSSGIVKTKDDSSQNPTIRLFGRG